MGLDHAADACLRTLTAMLACMIVMVPQRTVFPSRLTK